MLEDEIGVGLVARVLSALRNHLPQGCEVKIVGQTSVQYVSSSGASTTHLAEILKRQDVLNATLNVLNFVQDEVQRDTARPWPEWSQGLAMPQATLSSSVLRLWYGSEVAVALFVGEYHL